MRSVSQNKNTMTTFNIDAPSIRAAAADLQHFCHGQAAHNGWWTDMSTGQDLRSTGYPKLSPTANVGEKLMLVVTEVGEAMEGHRKLLMDDHIPNRSMLEVELADVVIRVFDLAGGLGLDVPGAMAEKLLFNSTRSDHQIKNRRAIGGKKI